MRKVESLMLSFLRQGITGKAGSNTEVVPHRYSSLPYLHVKLHGHVICTLSTVSGTFIIADAGWRTPTTKSRLNAILQEFAPRYRIVQRDYEWLLYEGDEARPWTGAARFHIVNGEGQLE